MTAILKAIRVKCVDCSGGSYAEVRLSRAGNVPSG
jgi:hypothetical protein